MKNLINEAKRMQQLAGILTESQLEEALNKDIRQFGQDLEKRLKEAGFLTMVAFHPKVITDQQQAEIKEDPKKVGLHVVLDPQYQALQLRGNAKSAKELEKIVNKFQVSNWNGPKMTFGSGWDTKTKQVVGAFNPGDIVGGGKGVNGSFYDANFVRYAVVGTKVKTDQGGKETTTSSKVASTPQAQPQVQQAAESLDIESVVNEALKAVRKKEVNELFGFGGGPTLKVGDEIEVRYDKPIMLTTKPATPYVEEGDGLYFKAKLIEAPYYFEIINYSVSEFDAKRGAAKKASSAYLYDGIKTKIFGKDNKIKVGDALQIENHIGPKIKSLKLNGKDVKQISLPKK